MNARLRTAAVSACLLLVGSAGFAADCRVNVATCTPEECAFLPGIGPTKGAAISAASPTSEEELDAVKGIGPATLESVRPYVAYEGATTCTSKQRKEG